MAPMNNDGQTKPARIFVGLKIGPEIAGQLEASAAELRETRARLVAASDFHLTLVPPWQEVLIDQAIGKLRLVAGMFTPFPLQLQHLGYGPQPRRPSLLWVDCEVTDELTALRDALMQAFPQEDSRPFRPHVTLARIRAGAWSLSRRHPIDRDLNLIQPVRTVELFQSPPPGTTGYQILSSVELGGPQVAAADTPSGGSITAG